MNKKACIFLIIGLLFVFFFFMHESTKQMINNESNTQMFPSGLNNHSILYSLSKLYDHYTSNESIAKYTNQSSSILRSSFAYNPHLHKTRNTSKLFEVPIFNMKNINSIVFIGDSNMYRQTIAYAKLHKKKCVTLSSRCNFKRIYPEFYRDKTSNYTWTKPQIGVEGPVKNGLVHPGCADCSGCDALACGESQQVRYFPIEFARDVMLQSKNYKNSQQVFAKHIAKHPAQTCVLNVGLHDLGILKITVVQYAKNVFDFVKQLHGCHYLIWQQITAVRGDLDKPQTNEKIERWNAVIKSDAAILKKLGNILYTYNISRQYRHIDNVHLTEKYYHFIAKTLPIVT